MNADNGLFGIQLKSGSACARRYVLVQIFLKRNEDSLSIEDKTITIVYTIFLTSDPKFKCSFI